MKRKRILIILLILTYLSPVSLYAQELLVEYTSKLNVESFGLGNMENLPENQRQSLEEAFGSIEVKHSLSYLNGKSVFKMMPFKEKPTISIFGVKMDLSKMMEEDLREVIYKNHNTNELRIRTIHRGKPYLVLDTIPVDSYTVQLDGCRKILGLDCQMAISKDLSTKIWFTSEYPIFDGPNIPANVKGLILAVENKEVFIEAKSIKYKVKQTLVPPTGGKKIDLVQYNKFLEEE